MWKKEVFAYLSGLSEANCENMRRYNRFPDRNSIRNLWNARDTKSVATFDIIIPNSEAPRMRSGKVIIWVPVCGFWSAATIINERIIFWNGKSGGIPSDRGRSFSENLGVEKICGLVQFFKCLWNKPTYMRQPLCYSTGKSTLRTYADFIFSPFSW